MGNREHAQYKYAAFKFLKSVYNERKNPGWGSEWFQVKTSCHPCLNVYKNKAPETAALLDELGWAWLYGDDGHIDSHYSYIHTEHYGQEGSQIIADALAAWLGKKAEVKMYLGGTPKKERYMIKMPTESANEFMERVAPYMATGMEYKIRDCFKHRIGWERGGF